MSVFVESKAFEVFSIPNASENENDTKKVKRPPKKTGVSSALQKNKVLRAIWSTRDTIDVQDRRVFIKTSLKELIIYLMFVALLLMIAFLSINSKTFFYYTSVNDLFVAKDMDKTVTSFEDISTIEDVWKYIRVKLVNSIYWDTWYNNRNVSFNEKEFIGLDNKLLGVPRLRQMRVDPGKCTVPSEIKKVMQKCYPAYSWSSRNVHPIPIQGGLVPVHTKDAWVYHTPAEIGATEYAAPHGSYDGSGYKQDLSRSRDETQAILDELFIGRWIDEATRVLFVDFTIYNVNINMFVIVKLTFEMPYTGGVFASAEVQPAKLLRYLTSLDYFVLACEVVYMLFIFYYVIEEILEISNKGWRYFTSVWNLMDIAMIVISFVCASFIIYSCIIVNLHMKKLVSEISTYPAFDYLSYWYGHYIRAIALCVFIAIIKVFKYFTIDQALNQLTRTLSIAAYDLLGFAVMFGIVYFAFAQLGYLAFGALTEGYSTFTQSTYSLFRMMVGDVDFPSLYQAQFILGPLFFLTFIFFVFFILLNMFLAIIDDAYATVKEELIKQKNALRLGHLVKKKTKDMLKKIKKRKTKSIARILRDTGLADLEMIPFEQYRRTLKTFGYSDAEVASTFLKYDADGDNCLNIAEQQRMRDEIEIGLIYKNTGPDDDEGIGSDDENKVAKATLKTEVEYIDPADYAELVQHVDVLEASLISLVTRASELLASLEQVEMAKREHRGRLANMLAEMGNINVTGNDDKENENWSK